MTERPILMSGPMVRAILEGRKTQTRRVERRATPPSTFAETAVRGMFCCPYGGPGDRLWVRETWAPRDAVALEQAANGDLSDIFYRADDQTAYKSDGPWRPSIFMPRALSRLTLVITDVRVQRVQEMSEGDALAEGVGHGFQMNGGWPDYGSIRNGICERTQDTAVMSFATLWDSVRSGERLKRGEGWALNPWVWALTFKRVA